MPDANGEFPLQQVAVVTDGPPTAEELPAKYYANTAKNSEWFCSKSTW